MKIGILTQSLSNNYGGLLQNYALQKVLKQRGHDVCTLDWKWVKKNSIRSYVRKVINYLTRKNRRNFYALTLEEDTIIHQNVYHFRDTYIKHTEKFESHADFVKYEEMEKPDAYIVGSDQCWRPKYNPFQGEMFLNFVSRNNIKRIAYAASFGTDEWEFLDTRYAKLTQLFNLVTVREKSGIELCKKHLGVGAKNVLDPTLLLDKEDYIKLIEAEEEKQSDGNLFYYILDPTKEVIGKIENVGQKYQLKLFKVLPKYKEEYRTKENVKDSINACIYPSPTKWLRGIMDAKMTIVDSFHGMVFSIIFNKPFWVIGNTQRGMSRFTSLLELFDLKDRLIDVSTIDKIDLALPINWEKVNEIRMKKKQESLSILFSALENE